MAASNYYIKFLSLRPALLEELHSKHLRIMCMNAVTQSIIWWPLMDSEIEEVAKASLSIMKCLHYHQYQNLQHGNGLLLVELITCGISSISLWWMLIQNGSNWNHCLRQPVQQLSNNWDSCLLHLTYQNTLFWIMEINSFLMNSKFSQRPTIPFTPLLHGHQATNGQMERFVQSFKAAIKRLIRLVT